MARSVDVMKSNLDTPAVPADQPSEIAGVDIDWPAIWRKFRLNPSDPSTQALLLVCRRYNLDPLLKHVVLIEGNIYITRDGLLHVAHLSGDFDGIEVVEGPTELDNGDWTAKVAVYRKSMSRAVVYPGRYPAKGKNPNFRPEMSIKVAECMALRRAFDVSLASYEEQYDELQGQHAAIPEATEEERHDALKEQVTTWADRLHGDGVVNEEQRDKAREMASESLARAREAMDRLLELQRTARTDS